MSNYAICTMKKFNSSKITKLEKHNERKNESYSNKEINQSRSHLNFSLVEDDRPLREKIDSELKEHYHYERKIQSNAVLLNGFIIGASPEYMDQLSKEEQREYFETAKQYFDETYGHVVSADVHLDETNPHMHLGLVPLVEVPEKNHTTLSSKKLFDRNELRKLQSEFPEHMQKHGFEVKRGVKEGQKKYIKNIEDYKKLNHRKVLEYFEKTEPDKIVNNLKDKSETFFTHKVKYTKEEHQKIVDTFENLNRLVVDKDYLEKDLENVKSDKESLKSDKENLKDKISSLSTTIEKLLKEIKDIEKNHLQKTRDFRKKIQFYQNYFNEFDIKEKNIHHVQRATEDKGFNNLIDKSIIKQRLEHFNEQLVDDPSVNQDDFLKITVDEVKVYAKDINEIYTKKHAEKLKMTEKDEKISYHYIRKALFKVLQDHPRVEMHDGYYQILSDNDLIIKEQEKQVREQRQKEYQEFKAMMNDKASYNNVFINKVLKEYVSNKDVLNINRDELRSIGKLRDSIKARNKDDIIIFTKKNRAVYSKVIGKEVAFKDFYKFNSKRFKRAVVNTTFNMAFSPKKHNHVKKAISRYKNLLQDQEQQNEQARQQGIEI